MAEEPAQEVCNNAVDDDGNGLVDEGCTLFPELKQQPAQEVSGNNTDDNGDGLVDENCPVAQVPPKGNVTPTLPVEQTPSIVSKCEDNLTECIPSAEKKIISPTINQCPDNDIACVDDLSTFQSYTNNELGISLKHPSDWKFASLKNGIQLIKEKNGIYVEIRKHTLESSNTNLKQYVFNDIKDRRSSRQDFEMHNITETMISGNLPAHKTEYSFLKSQDQKDFASNGTTNKILRFWTFANGNAYTLAYVSESDDYGLYLPIALKIIDSLKINPQE